jgi:hypothetical protein
VIPGPKKPCDFDSFLWPLVQELLQLKIGVSAFNAITKVVFLLHAYLIVIFGDILAVSMIMRMKGHNTISPCRMCTIKGVHIPFSQVTMHYVPLCCDGFPNSQEQYDPCALLLQNHISFMEQAIEVQYASTNVDYEGLATKYGIKGLPLLSTLSSLSFPVSFSYDFMHLIWTNLIPNLICFWTGNFKDISHQDEGYVLVLMVWETIGEATVNAGRTIPAAFSSRIPNIAAEKVLMIAKRQNSFNLDIIHCPYSPQRPICAQKVLQTLHGIGSTADALPRIQITQDQVNDLESSFQSWVQKYEQYVFLVASRMPSDRLTVYTTNMIHCM